MDENVFQKIMEAQLEKKALIQRIHDITQENIHLLAQANTVLFQKNIQKRQVAIHDVETQNALLRCIRQEIGEQAYKEVSSRDELVEIRNEIHKLLQKTIEADQIVRESATGMLEHYRTQIKSIRQTKKGVGGYTKAASENDNAVYLDAKK